MHFEGWLKWRSNEGATRAARRTGCQAGATAGSCVLIDRWPSDGLQQLAFLSWV